jgi:hypothetical protein
MTKQLSHAAIWSQVFPALGLLTLAGLTTMEGVYVFSTASQHHMIWGIPSDGLGKLVLGLAVSLIAFGGAAVVGAKLADDRKYVRKGAMLAIIMTFGAYLFSAANLSGYFAWTRQAAEVAALTGTTRYAAAVSDAKFFSELRAAGRPLSQDQFDRSKEVDQIMKDATPPATADRQVGDWIKGLLAHALVLGMASAFSLPKQQRKATKAKTKKRAKPAGNVVALNKRA